MKKLIQATTIILLIHTFSFAQYMQEKTISYQVKPIVQMELNGQRIWVLLDTGSDVNILDLRSKNKYGFKAYKSIDREMRVNGFSSEKNLLLETGNVHLYYNDIRMKDRFFSYDISGIVKSIRNRTGKTISAIIGTNMMRSYGFVIDLGNNTISMNHKIKKKDLKSPKYGAEYTIAKGNL